MDGFGTWSPNISLEGRLDIQSRADNALVNGLNLLGVFSGTILNAENIGTCGDKLVALWNETNPDDQID